MSKTKKSKGHILIDEKTNNNIIQKTRVFGYFFLPISWNPIMESNHIIK